MTRASLVLSSAASDPAFFALAPLHLGHRGRLRRFGRRTPRPRPVAAGRRRTPPRRRPANRRAPPVPRTSRGTTGAEENAPGTSDARRPRDLNKASEPTPPAEKRTNARVIDGGSASWRHAANRIVAGEEFKAFSFSAREPFSFEEGHPGARGKAASKVIRAPGPSTRGARPRTASSQTTCHAARGRRLVFASRSRRRSAKASGSNEGDAGGAAAASAANARASSRTRRVSAGDASEASTRVTGSEEECAGSDAAGSASSATDRPRAEEVGGTEAYTSARTGGSPSSARRYASVPLAKRTEALTSPALATRSGARRSPRAAASWPRRPRRDRRRSTRGASSRGSRRAPPPRARGTRRGTRAESARARPSGRRARAARGARRRSPRTWRGRAAVTRGGRPAFVIRARDVLSVEQWRRARPPAHAGVSQQRVFCGSF